MQSYNLGVPNLVNTSGNGLIELYKTAGVSAVSGTASETTLFGYTITPGILNTTSVLEMLAQLSVMWPNAGARTSIVRFKLNGVTQFTKTFSPPGSIATYNSPKAFTWNICFLNSFASQIQSISMDSNEAQYVTVAPVTVFGGTVTVDMRSNEQVSTVDFSSNVLVEITVQHSTADVALETRSYSVFLGYM